MKSLLIFALLFLCATLLAVAQQPAPATSQSMSATLGLHSFPSKNQTAEQQQQDEMACYNWAKQDSGYDPIAAAVAQQQATTPPPSTSLAPSTKGAGAKGAAGGAAKGAVVGAITGDAASGAAAGAAVGGMRGRAKARQVEKQAKAQAEQQQQKQAQQQAQEKDQAQQKLDGFKKAFSACMEGKGYSVK